MKKKGMTPKQAQRVRIKIGNHINTKLQNLRIKKGLSQNDLAEKSGIPSRTIKAYEQHQLSINCAKLENLCKLAFVLECTIADLLEDKTLIEMYNKVK